ncbi:histone-lysine N-methyltransferase, H3 lysine-9 specific SUVH4-like isoform X2 [Olea europaea var. sylvestris]|uniref:histone-lysine N-methyltransferase, H3 lysine-9 specific SUVH4-like isoform X2 n=1 Tax=Olea europaea var. sylvestris TaxID=158386 RepID=UPI000C1D1840|nr:histone-lysine N-methyltransferase, H3 lysine-9 specific SUVH4-like isoform X2 [Olea europaea var. sylvestris]
MGVPACNVEISAENGKAGVNSDAVAPLRRSSARLQKMQNQKSSSVEVSAENESGSNGIRKESSVSRKNTGRAYRKRKVETPHATVLPQNGVVGEATETPEMVNGGDTIISSSDSLVGKSAHTKVTETLRTFNKYYLHFIQEEEKRCKRQEVDQKSPKSSKSKKNCKTADDTKRGSKRPDLKAITKMMEMGAILNPEKRFGSIPGIDVGHQFFSRAEMVVVGFHGHWLNGIDFIGSAARNSLLDCSQYTLPLATSIVLSGQYEDDQDNCEDVVYTGQGGNNLLGDKRQIRDQVMERGNLGLKNCMEQSIPVRVTRGHQCRKNENSYAGKVYTYDGLYKVVKYWAEKGVSGFTVYKFRLKRLDGQPPLTTNQVYFTRGRIPNSISEIRGLVCEDITGGQEEIPIPVTNLVDEPPIPPKGFTYIKGMKFAKNIIFGTKAPPGCNCQGKCTDPRTCACAKLNGGDFPYVHSHGGRLIEPKAVVFECGPNCGCGPDCVNRISQRPPNYRLEVFRTPRMGWGVRSWDYIPSGAPVCEYIGLLMKTDDIDPAADNSYVFDIDCLQTMNALDGRERRLRDVTLPSHVGKVDETSESVPFCIDAGQTGNFARFINHSCQPNLFVQCVLSNHHDIKLARVILMAADNIPPLKELTYDYGYALDSVMGPDGKIKQMLCYCGAADCRKRLF